MRLNLFASKRKITKVPKLNMTYKNMQIKQHSKITYLCCILDRTMSGKSMVLKVINKINLILKFLHRKKYHLSQVSILGPLLILIYVNETPQAVKLNLFLYADNSCLIFQGKGVIEIKRQLNGDFTKICEFFFRKISANVCGY